MKKTHLLLISLLFCSYSYSQSDSIPSEKKKEALVLVEKMPQFPGGNAKLYEFLATNMKYPKKAKEKGVQGKVYIQFLIEKDGSISNIKVLRGIGGGCDKEAVRVVKLMPNWTPGEQKGKLVKVKYVLPINFKLKSIKEKKKKRRRWFKR